jgi:hypothetical protein
MEALILKEGTMKHSNRLVVATAVILTVFVASASHAETPYFPLEVGMEWHYSKSYDWDPPSDTVMVAVTGTVVIDSTEYYVINNYFVGGCGPNDYYVREDGGKIWIRQGNQEKILYDFENFPWCEEEYYYWGPVFLTTGDECFTNCRGGCPDAREFEWVSPTRFRIGHCMVGTDHWWTEEFEEGVGLVWRNYGYYMGWPEWHDYYYNLVSFTDPTSVRHRSWGNIKALFRQ